MKSIFPLFSLLCFSPILFAQQTKGDFNLQDNLNRSAATGMGMVQTFDTRYEGVRGTPFVQENFEKGFVVYKTGKEFDIDFLNFNAFENEILFRNSSSGPTLIITKDLISSFIIGDRKFVNLQAFELEEDRFVEVLVSNNRFYVVKKHVKKLEEADYQGAYSSNKKFDEFYNKDEYYKIKGNNLTSFKLNKKSIINTFTDSPFDLKEYFKKNSVDFKNQKEVAHFFSLFQ